jgi:hypothetical protein
MAGNSDVEVLIVEDSPTEAPKIIKWFGLSLARCKASRAFREAASNATPETGWLMLKKEIVATNPRVVVIDYLLTGLSGSNVFDGIEYSNRCKHAWPHLGVILVTSGGDGELEGVIRSQKELDEQKNRNDWSMDHAWVKPWGPSADASAHRPVQDIVKVLIEQSWRANDH